jgi:haloacetate dehalogenase
MAKRHFPLPWSVEQHALAHYDAAYGDPSGIHGMCEDYRAGRTTDLERDEADRAAGEKIRCPVLAFWGTQGLPADAGIDTLACWRDWASDLRGIQPKIICVSR